MFKCLFISAILFTLTFSAHASEAYKAKPVELYQSKPVEVYKAKTLDSTTSPGPSSSEQKNVSPTKNSNADVAELLGAWQTAVPGGVWTSPSAFPGWDTLHVSPGALSGLLVIYSDGTYAWNAYGGKKGQWKAQNRSGYPIVLEDQAEGRSWNVGKDKRHPGKIWIWDGKAFNYQGSRPRN